MMRKDVKEAQREEKELGGAYFMEFYHTMYERREGQKCLGRRNMKGKHDRKGERRKGLNFSFQLM